MSWGDDVIELAPPATAAVPLGELAAHLRLSEGFEGEDEAARKLDGLARAASAAVEGMIGKALIQRRFRWSAACWRDSVYAPLPVVPVRQVHGITLIDAAGSWTAVEAERWELRADAPRPGVAGAGGRNLPSIPRAGRAEVEFTAGYGADWNGVPEALRHAVMLLAGHYHEQRHAAGDRLREIPHGVAALISPFRQVRL